MHVHVTQLRGIPLLMAAMKTHRTAPDVQANACRLLANLALTGHNIPNAIPPILMWCAGQVRDYLIKENVPMYVMYAVKDLTSSVDVQHYGFWCLANLAVDGPPITSH